MANARYATFMTAAKAGASLHNYEDRIVLKLKLDPGKYLVWGRVVLTNWDHDTQRAFARLRLIDGPVVDWMELVLASEVHTECVTVQGAVDVPSNIADLTHTGPPRIVGVEIECSSYNATAAHPSLLAIQVDAATDDWTAI